MSRAAKPLAATFDEDLLVELAVADAPEITPDLAVVLRRVLKPYVQPSRASHGLSSPRSAA